jgi:hypothetical protein
MSGRLSVEALLDGVVQTLTERVLPSVSSRFARGQLYAAVDVLRNLRDRVEVKAALLEAEAASAASALGAALDAAGDTPQVAPLRALLAAAPASLPERVVALRAALGTTLAALHDLPPDVAAAARRPLHEHLAAQAMRDLAILKPSLLGEISRG